ncbi:MAG: response regulator transcription factor [Polyangiaceae bacterium]
MRPRAPRVLLVEDDDLTRALLASELEGEGFVVAEAGDGEDGLCQVPGFRPDVVVLDLMLPRLNGFAVARAMRALERPPGVGIVAVTGLAAEALRAEALGAGCDVVLTKPVRVALLVERVRGLLSASRPDPSIDATPRVGKA